MFQLRILIASPSYAPIVGGVETFVENVVRILRQRGYATDLLTTHMDKKWRVHPSTKVTEGSSGEKVIRWGGLNPVEYIRLSPEVRIGCRGLSSSARFLIYSILNVHFLPLPGLRRLYRSYDILHFNDDDDLTLPLYAFGLRDRSMMHLHTLAATESIYRYSPLARAILTSCASLYVSNSEDSAHRAARLGISYHRLSVIPNGVDTKVFCMPNGTRQPNRVLFVGRLVREKGLHVLLDALAQVKEPVELDIVGEFRDVSYEREVHEKADQVTESGLHVVNFLGSKVGVELPRAYQRAAIFVTPSFAESFGLTALEAMSCGCFVIASRTGGLTAIFQDRDVGVLVEPGNAQQIAQALRYALENPAQCAEYGRRGRTFVKQSFSWESVVDQLLDIYERLLAR